MDLSSAIKQWQALLGESNVLVGQAVLDIYGGDTTGAQRQIPAALLIQEADSLPAVMAFASQYRVPVYPISTGQNWGYGTALPARDGCVIIDLSRLRRIVDFDAELGVVTLEPGVTQGMLADYLDAGNHPFLVPVTGAGPSCSLLANALERGYGVTPYVDHFGAVTDLEAVLPDGSLFRTAMKEAGGEELSKLFKYGIGPYSTGLFTQSGFGIVTQMTIALARRPECIKVCLFNLKDDALLETAVLRIRSIMSRCSGIVGAINLMNQHRVLSMAAPYPKEQLGPDGMIPEAVLSALGKQYRIYPWTGFGTLYGTKRLVEAAQKEMKSALGDIATRMMFVTPQRSQQLARLTQLIPGKLGQGLQGMTATLAKSLELVSGRPNETALPLVYWRGANPQTGPLKNPGRDGCGLIWYAPLVPMRPADLRAYVRMVKEIAPRYGLEPLITLTTVSDKLFDSTVPLLFDRSDIKAVEAANACYKELINTGRSKGWFPYRVGVDSMANLVALQSDSKNFHHRLRKDLDPHDLLAPGRYR
jgi:4-cresol dehydrogenase (hydroxylating) flavoprotein subunit